MDGTTSTARQASGGEHARYAGTAHRTAAQLVKGGSRARQAGAVVRIPPLADSQGNNFAAQWPLQSFLELGALPGAVPCARLHARQRLWEWWLTSLSDTIELLVSELVTNAMQVSRAAMQDDPIRLWLLSDKAQVVILVWDASPLSPVPMDAGGDAENGRGLLLVEAISARWGWHFPQDMGGKVVWAQTLLE
jgi:hypothetical protein